MIELDENELFEIEGGSIWKYIGAVGTIIYGTYQVYTGVRVVSGTKNIVTGVCAIGGGILTLFPLWKKKTSIGKY